jgi:hypothetical protein
MNSFVALDDVILPPPGGAAVALAIVLGTWQLSRIVATRSAATRDAAFGAACFVATAHAIAALAHALAWSGFALVPALTAIGVLLGAMGIWRVAQLVNEAPAACRGWMSEWHRLSALARVGAIVALPIPAGLLLGALGPVTDADSLDYHVGVPLDWLRHGVAFARPEWFHARLVGIGESLTLLGLAMGSEQLSAAYQAAGLLAAIGAVGALARTADDRVLAALLVVTVPVMAFLVPNQKPMLLPCAGLAASLVLIVRAGPRPPFSTLALCAVCASGAMASKHSFILPGLVVVIVAGLRAWREGWLGRFVVVGGMGLLLFAVPTWARTWVFYGDPLSPFLERFVGRLDPSVAGFADELRAAGLEPTFTTFLALPWTLVVPRSPGELTTVLGLGTWGVLLALRASGGGRWLMAAAGATTALVTGFGQIAPRFFLDAYLWAAAALVGCEVSGKRLVFAGLIAQGVLAAALAGFVALSLASGSVSWTQRARVMDLTASGAAEARWMDRVLPKDAVVFASTRSHALLPRPFAMMDDLLGDLGARQDAEMLRTGMLDRLRRAGVTVVVATPASASLLAGCLEPLAGPKAFHWATRNPANRGRSYELEAYSLRLDAATCRSFGPPGAPANSAKPRTSQ